jgi:cyclopropane-fatty-acyl-phospholipid synthase
VLPSLSAIARASGELFRFTHLESFGADYDKTLMAWSANLEKNWNTIRNAKNEKGDPLFDERFFRKWQYYLLICAGAFRSKKIDVSQIVLSK